MSRASSRRTLLTASLLALGTRVLVADTGEWTQVKSPHFVVCSDAGGKEARRIALRFEQIRAILQQAWPWARLDPGRPVLVVAARDAATFEQLVPALQEREGRAPVAGLFQRGLDKHLVLLRADASKSADKHGYFANPYHTIYHEYVHLVLALNFGNIPPWLAEGLAEYWGDLKVEGDQVKVGLPIAGHVLLLRQRGLLNPEVLLHVGDESPHYWEKGKAEVFYASSWALVHYLIAESGSREQNPLSQYLQLLKAGTTPEAAAQQALPDSWALDKGVEAYLRRLTFKGHVGKAPLPETSAKRYSERPLSTAEVRALEGELLARFARNDEARAEAQRALEEAAHLDPKLAAPQEMLALLAFYSKDLGGAIRYLARAAELQSSNAFTHYLRGLIALRLGTDTLSEAEAALQRAAQLNPDFAPTYTALAEAAARRGAPLDKVEPLARRAIALEPGIAEHRLRFAWVLWQAGQMDRAKSLAEEALRATQDESDRSLLQAFLDDMSRSVRRP